MLWGNRINCCDSYDRVGVTIKMLKNMPSHPRSSDSIIKLASRTNPENPPNECLYLLDFRLNFKKKNIFFGNIAFAKINPQEITSYPSFAKINPCEN